MQEWENMQVSTSWNELKENVWEITTVIPANGEFWRDQVLWHGAVSNGVTAESGFHTPQFVCQVKVSRDNACVLLPCFTQWISLSSTLDLDIVYKRYRDNTSTTHWYSPSFPEKVTFVWFPPETVKYNLQRRARAPRSFYAVNIGALRRHPLRATTGSLDQDVECSWPAGFWNTVRSSCFTWNQGPRKGQRRERKRTDRILLTIKNLSWLNEKKNCNTQGSIITFSKCSYVVTDDFGLRGSFLTFGSVIQWTKAWILFSTTNLCLVRIW